MRKLQYEINKMSTKISALYSGKIDKYEYLTCEKTLLLQQHRIIENAEFNYSLFKKALQKQTATSEKHGEKEVQPLKHLESSDKESSLIKFLYLEKRSILEI